MRLCVLIFVVNALYFVHNNVISDLICELNSLSFSKTFNGNVLNLNIICICLLYLDDFQSLLIKY